MRGAARLKLYASALGDFCRFARPGGKFLIAGPYIGEFGYECMEWQSFVNAQVPKFERVYAVSYPGRKALYPECEFVPHRYDLVTAGYGHGSTQSAALLKHATEIAVTLGLGSYRVLLPTATAQPFIRRLMPQRWVEFGRASAFRCDVAFHFRDITKTGTDQRLNFPLASADQLAEMCRRAGLVCIAIGHPEQSYCPPQCTDRRTLELQETMDTVAGARLVVGQLSGPMHLASLCKKDILIWADGAHRIALARQWNPHHAGIHVLTDTTFCPDAEDVMAVIRRLLGHETQSHATGETRR